MDAPSRSSSLRVASSVNSTFCFVLFLPDVPSGLPLVADDRRRLHLSVPDGSSDDGEGLMPSEGGGDRQGQGGREIRGSQQRGSGGRSYWAARHGSEGQESWQGQEGKACLRYVLRIERQREGGGMVLGSTPWGEQVTPERGVSEGGAPSRAMGNARRRPRLMATHSTDSFGIIGQLSTVNSIWYECLWARSR